jgi:uncharacterized phage protein (TIGR01671 family)
MNREIKFRFWRDNKMQTAHQLNSYEDYNFSGDGEILMQFTGLHDKNGKEIYEGDILKKHYGSSVPIFAVAWHKEGMMFIQNDGYDKPLFEISPEYIEIIGNIYENPELLTP